MTTWQVPDWSDVHSRFHTQASRSSSLKGDYIVDKWTSIGLTKGDTRSYDYFFHQTWYALLVWVVFARVYRHMLSYLGHIECTDFVEFTVWYVTLDVSLRSGIPTVGPTLSDVPTTYDPHEHQIIWNLNIYLPGESLQIRVPRIPEKWLRFLTLKLAMTLYHLVKCWRMPAAHPDPFAA